MGRQLWLATEPRRWGLRVLEVDGWQTRGSATFNPGGTGLHHTAGAATGEIPSLKVLVKGRSDLPGPLCNWGLGRSGTVYVVASGRANHMGRGYWEGLTGNSAFIGIEAESVGNGKDWTAEQRRVYPILVACAQFALRRDARYVAAHREYATPAGRKIDPTGINMPDTRRQVAALLAAGPGSTSSGVVVMPEFHVVLDGPVVSRTYPESGGVLLLTATGQIVGLDTSIVAQFGMPKGHQYFIGMRAAVIRRPTAQELQTIRPGIQYVVVTETGHTYHYGS